MQYMHLNITEFPIIPYEEERYYIYGSNKATISVVGDVVGPIFPTMPLNATSLLNLPMVCHNRALQLRREAQMVSPVMGAAMIGTMYFLRANCAQHGGSASGGGLISASLLSYRALCHSNHQLPYNAE